MIEDQNNRKNDDLFKNFVDEELFAEGQDPFKDFIDHELMTEDDEDKPKNEYDAIKRVLDRLSEEYGVSFDLMTSDNLNSRIEAVNVIFYLPDDIINELQKNNLSDEQLQMIEDKLTNERFIMRASEDELKRMLEAIGDLMTYVELDSEQIFIDDQKRKFALLKVLLSSFQFVENALATKEDRDHELLQVREYLESKAIKIVTHLKEAIQKYEVDNPDIGERKDEAVEKIQILLELIKLIGVDAHLMRQYLRRIDDLMTNVVRISLSGRGGMKFVFDDQAFEDAQAMIRELAEDYPAN